MSISEALHLTTRNYLTIQRYTPTPDLDIDGITIELHADDDGALLCALGPNTLASSDLDSATQMLWLQSGDSARVHDDRTGPAVGRWGEPVWIWPTLEVAADALRAVLPHALVDDIVCQQQLADAAGARAAALRHPHVTHHRYAFGEVHPGDPQFGRCGAISLHVDDDVGTDRVEACIDTLPLATQRARLAAVTTTFAYHEHLRRGLTERERAAVLRAYDAMVADGRWPAPPALRQAQDDRNAAIAKSQRLETMLTLAEIAITTAQQEDRAPTWPPAESTGHGDASLVQ